MHNFVFFSILSFLFLVGSSIGGAIYNRPFINEVAMRTVS